MPIFPANFFRTVGFALAVCAAAFGQSSKHLYVSVEGSKSGPITGLSASNFSVKENGVDQVLDSVASEAEPMSIGIVFDAIGTVGLSFFENDKDEFAPSIDDLANLPGAAHEYFIAGFNRQSVIFVDWTSESQKIRAAVGRFSELKPKEKEPGSPIYDVAGEAFKSFDRAGHRKKVLLIFSDGLDKGSTRGRREVLALAGSKDVLVHTFALTDGAYNIDTSPNLYFLETMARTSGGSFNVLFTSVLFARGGGRFVPVTPLKGSEIRRTIAGLITQMNSQYRLTFRSDTKGEIRYKVKVALNDAIRKGKGEISVRHRELLILAG